MLGAALALTAVAPAAKAASVDADPTPWAAPANGESAATITPDTEIDPSTIADWRKWIEEAGTMTTNNVGRVWTDKSVYNDDLKLTAAGPGATVEKGDDDFIVALSALSSYSNLTTTSSKPLDIVLMLDMSGSMDDYSYTHEPVYAGALSQREVYYIDLNGTYQKVEYSSRRGGWGYYDTTGWFDRWQSVTPKTSADDNGNTQFYEAARGEKKITALRNAVEGFINSTAAANEKIADPAKRHHLSVAKFAGDRTSESIATSRNETYRASNGNTRHFTQRITALSEVNEANKETVIESMRRVSPQGCTAADSALSFSGKILEGSMRDDEAREEAQKVVIFFTDGEPNYGNGFDENVAIAAITNAGALKTANTMVYSIGMFGGANPDDTGATGSHRFNAYMNGVSSNYPNAISFDNLGQRVDPKKDYYFAAGDADQLNQIFQDIFTDIEQQSTGSPTLVEGSDPTEGGYITFNDQLGSYMTVSGFKKILFANNQYEQVETKNNPDGTITYTFKGTYDADATDPDHPYKTVDLSDILITVYPGPDAKTGDRVTVKVPAADIPISKYKITNENGNTEFEHVQAYPLVVTYGVKVKDEVADLIGKPDADMSAYIAANTTDEGKLAFYSNAFEKAARDGLTTASFTPSLGNNFNRYVEDTLLYSDADCTNPVDYRNFSPENNDYYYKRTQYVKEKGGTGAREETLKIALRHGPEVSVLDVKDGNGYKYVARDAEGHAYIVAGAPRIQRVSSDISADKMANTTGTAATSNNPYWEQNEDGVYDHITIKLGNNGKKEIALPGALSVTKKATVAAGSVGPVDQDGASTLDKTVFKVTVTMTGLGEQKEFPAAVVDAEGKIVSDPQMKVSFANGSWGQNLKNGETLHIYGLPAGATYTVEELDTDMPKGFALKSVTDAQGKEKSNTGTIVGGDTEALVLNNEYEAAATDEESGLFTAQKEFGDWDNVKNDAGFDIRMIATYWPGKNEGADPTFPKGADVIHGKRYEYVSHIVKKSDPKKGDPFDFGGISFTHAGTYVYNIGEYVPGTGAADRLPGVNYSNEVYRVTIVVKDDGKGKLAVESSKMQKLMSAESWGDAIDPAVAVITNTYNINETPVDLEGFKDYTDETGGNPLTPAKFTFAITPLTEGAPVPMSWRVNKYEPFEKLGNPDYPDAYKSQNYQTGEINLGTLLLTGDHIKDGAETTYVYKLQEVPGSEVGMTYDGSVYYAHVTVRAVTGQTGVTVVEAKLKYTHDEAGNNLVDPDDPSGAIVFTNVYKAQNEGGRAHASVNGSKTLTGRDMAVGEAFGFGLSAADPATQRAVDNGVVALPAESATVSGARNGEEEPFSFGDLTFSKVGTYKFNVSELAWNGERIPADGTKGMKFDRHSCGVTVDVTLDKATGELKASATYAHGDKAVFSNSYSATTGAFSGLTVTKTLTGRAMKPKDFTFKIEAVGDAPKPTKEDASFFNALPQASGQTEYMTGKLDNLRFTQADAGKTFEYTVSEQKPAGAQDENPSIEGFQYKGVTYDENEYKLQLTPKDNGDGTMSIATKVLNAAGDEVSQSARIDFSNSYSASGSLVGADNLKGTKKLSGDLPDGMTPAGYNFKLEHVDASGSPVAPDPAVLEMPKETVVTSDGRGSFAFGNIVFHQSGTYCFMVSEVIPAEEDKVPGITYTSKEVLVKIVVTDNDDGTLSAKKTEGTQPLTFVNAYHANATGEVVIPVTKKVVGSASGDGQFSFELVATGKTLDAVKKGFVSADGLDANTGRLTVGVPAMADGESKGVNFAGLTFSEPGEYTFQISEVIPDPIPAHWTYDEHVCNVTIKVTDRGAQLVASESYEGARDWLNIYFDENEAKDVSKQDAPQTSVDGKLVGVGDTLVYTIDWVNNAVDENGVPVAAEITVTDKVPAGTEFVAASEGGKLADGKVTWSLGEKEPGASGTVRLTVKVTNDAVTTVENQASITIGKGDPLATNKVVVDVPGKSVVEPGDPDGSIQVGDTVKYAITYKNAEGAPATVTVVDVLPKGLTYSEGTASDGGAYDPEVHKLMWVLENVPAGEKGEVTFEAKVNANAVIGMDPVTNKATIQLGDDPAVESNTTSTEIKTGNLSVTKNVVVDGDQGTVINAEKEFEFAIELKDAGGEPLEGAYALNVAGATGTIGNGQTFKLKHGQTATISGLPEGAHYTLTETRVDGYTVSAKGDIGTIKADKTVEASFTNTYSAKAATLPAESGFKASKVLEGRDWMDGDTFDVQLKAIDGAPMPSGAKDGVLVKRLTKDVREIAFGEIQYPAVGTYTYEISEVPGNLAGITYSQVVYTVSVEVTDAGNGKLEATFDGKYVVKGAQDASPAVIAEFVNSYGATVPAKPVTTSNLFSKVLTGRDWKKEDSFSFTITPLNGAPEPEHLVATLTGLTTAAGDTVPFDFGTINFTFDHIKDVPVVNGVRKKAFEYEVRENVPADGDKIPGVTYDRHVATLTITLTDDGSGVLSASSVVRDSGRFTKENPNTVATFINTYTTEPVNPDGDGAMGKDGIQIVKTMTGRPITAGDFEFTMAPVDDVTKAKFGDAKVIATNAAELGTGELTNTAIATTPVKTGLKFTLEDVGKTYKFELSESKGGGIGYVNDQTKHALKFTTDDNVNGTLSVTVTLDDKEAAVWTSGAELTPVSIGFANSYSADSIAVGGQGGVALTGTKRLTGRPMVAGEFHFNVTNAKDQAEPAAVVATGTNAANGTITFTGIEYTTEKLNNDVAAGLATVDRAGKDGDVYTYTYNVSEDAGRNDKGVSIIQGTQAVTVRVTDNRAGKLSAEVVYPQDGMVFKNAYGTGADGTKVITLKGTKDLDVKSGNKAPDIAGKYTFELSGSEGAPMPAKTTATNDAAGNISFGEITYTMENVFGAPAAKPEQPAIAEDKADAADAEAGETVDAAKAADASDAQANEADAEAESAEGESAVKAAATDEPMVASAPRSKAFTYKVTENGSVAGVTNDPVATKTITVTVTDKGDGTLTVDKQAESNKTDFTFTNTYSVKPFDSTLTGEGGFAITKTLDGRDLREGEFEFALVSQGEGEPTVVTAKNDANGKVAFPAISFNAPGEYHYRLAEVDGGLGGVTYDTTVYDVTATVVDNGDGTLGTTWSVSKGGKALEGKEIVFANGYKAAGTSITFNAAKVLTGRELAKGEFTFELRDANGKVLQTVKNGALTEGGYAPIAFDPITYDEPGTYDYRIVEVKGDAEGITYDETVFTYHVVVTDDGNGQLQVEWTMGETGAPVFQNVFVKPEDLKPADPAKPADPGNGGSGDKLIQTGDSSLLGIAAAAVAGALALGAGIVKRRKSE